MYLTKEALDLGGMLKAGLVTLRMALFGWMTPATAALYTRKVHRKKLAFNAARGCWERLPNISSLT